MTALSQEEYERRRADLARQKTTADGLYEAACYHLQQGTVEQAEVDEARLARDRIEDKLRGLDAAFKEAQRRATDNRVKERDAAFFALVKETDANLSERAKVAETIFDTAEALGKALAKYDALTKAGQSFVHDYRRNHARDANLDGVNHAFSAVLGPSTIAGSLIAQQGVLPRTLDTTRFILEGKSPSDIEKREAAKIRSSVARLAPVKEKA
jgi:hypothetical protein